MLLNAYVCVLLFWVSLPDLVMSKSLGNAYLLDELQDTTAPFDESNTTETEGSNLGIFAGIMAPLAILIGFATASVGFTCWSIVVPLLWVGFGIDVFDSLFTSVATDWINSSSILSFSCVIASHC